MPSFRVFALLLGPLGALALFLTPVPDGLTREAWGVGALLLWMAIWWATEPIPIPATSLLPLVVLPLVSGLSMGQVAVGYSHPVVLLLLGGFIIALGVERWNLHKRIALNIVARAGHHPRALVGGFMLATAFLSMWISNTATTLMMVPIALSVATSTGDEDGPFVIALLLGVAYAASIGGIGTPIGTPTNLIAIDWLRENTGRDIGFANWLQFGIPAVLVLVPIAWFMVTRRIGTMANDAGHKAEITRQLTGLGRITGPEVRIALVFTVIALLWVIRVPVQSAIDETSSLAFLNRLNDGMIAIFGAILMFLVPNGKGGKDWALLTWEEATKLPWGVLLLFGGGIALGRAVTSTGLSEWLGIQLSVLDGVPTLLVVFTVVALVIFLTELTSNVATMTTLAPVLGALAAAIGASPESLLAPAAVAASCAFMLPVATAPNAVIYSTGRIAIPRMMQAGLRINLLGLVAITLIGAYIAPIALGG